MEKTKLIKDAPHQKYFSEDGTQLAGGSTICKIGDDPAGLLYWAWDLGKQGKDFRKERGTAANIGTIAHFMIECMLNSNVADLSDFDQADIDKALVCYSKFLDWWEGQNLKVVKTEIQLVNELYKFGGTIDLIAINPQGEYILLDFKTSKKISESYWRQLAGYAELWNYNNLGCKIVNHCIVRIGKEEEGDFEAIWRDDLSGYWETFKAQVKVWCAIKNEKPVKEKKTKKK